MYQSVSVCPFALQNVDRSRLQWPGTERHIYGSGNCVGWGTAVTVGCPSAVSHWRKTLQSLSVGNYTHTYTYTHTHIHTHTHTHTHAHAHALRTWNIVRSCIFRVRSCMFTSVSTCVFTYFNRPILTRVHNIKQGSHALFRSLLAVPGNQADTESAQVTCLYFVVLMVRSGKRILFFVEEILTYVT